MFVKSRGFVIAGALLTAASSGAVYAQSAPAQAPAAQQRSTGAMDIVNWQQAELRGGYSAERLIGMNVKGRAGNDLGQIEDMLIGRDGRTQAVIVSAGGVVGLGETHYRVPWQQVQFAPNMEHVMVPIAQDNVPTFRWGAEQIKAAANELRARQILDGNIIFRDGRTYGEVADLIIARDGEVKAVVAQAAQRDDRFAFPFRADALDAGQRAYRLPYEETQVNALRPFDYRAHQIATPTTARPAARGATDPAGATGVTTPAAGETAAGERRTPRQARPARQSKG